MLALWVHSHTPTNDKTSPSAIYYAEAALRHSIVFVLFSFLLLLFFFFLLQLLTLF